MEHLGHLSKKLEAPPLSIEPAWFQRQFCHIGNMTHTNARGAGSHHALSSQDSLCPLEPWRHYKPGPERYLYPLKKECLQMVLISGVEGYLERGIANAIYSLRLPSIQEADSPPWASAF